MDKKEDCLYDQSLSHFLGVDYGIIIHLVEGKLDFWLNQICWNILIKCLEKEESILSNS